MSKLSKWIDENKTSYKQYVVGAIAGAFIGNAVQAYIQHPDTQSPLTQATIAMSESSNYAETQLNMLPMQYDKITALIKEGKTEEAKTFIKGFSENVRNLKAHLPTDMKANIEIAFANTDDTNSLDVITAYNNLKPAFLSKEKGAFTQAVTDLYVALEFSDQKQNAIKEKKGFGI